MWLYRTLRLCHFQYYKYLLQILVLMLSLKRKETLLRVQCTGDSYQYFSSKVKHYMLPGSCPFAFFFKFSVFPLENCMCFPALALTQLGAENLNSNPAWDVWLVTFSSVLCTVRGSVVCEGKARSECGSG